MKMFHEISEGDHRILNPLTDAKLELLGEICRFGPTTTMLDLACGKGEMLCRWADRWHVSGMGVDTNASFLSVAKERARELGVADRVDFAEHDAATFRNPGGLFDVVSCIGATWVGGGLRGTLELMTRHLAPGGLLLVGEVYWIERPAAGEDDLITSDPSEFETLVGTLGRFEAAGMELIDMVLSDRDTWDRYQASQWHNVADWLASNPRHPQADDFRELNDRWRRAVSVVWAPPLGMGDLRPSSVNRTHRFIVQWVALSGTHCTTKAPSSRGGGTSGGKRDRPAGESSPVEGGERRFVRGVDELLSAGEVEHVARIGRLGEHGHLDAVRNPIELESEALVARDAERAHHHVQW